MWFEKETLDKAHSLASTISLIVIPVVIAIVGYSIQASISEQNIKKDYVQIAISILADPKTPRETDLRNWAVDVLSKNSPVPFTPKLKEKIAQGSSPFVLWANETSFGPQLIEPPAKLMEPPNKLLLPYEKNLTENEKAALENAEKLKNLQAWINTRNQSVRTWTKPNQEIPKWLIPKDNN